jgi:beta-carotene 3-hydroxylase
MIMGLAEVAIFLIAFIGMEGFAWVMHRYVMHGFLWCWHESHHRERDGLFELNDLFAVVFAMPAILFIWLGVNGSIWFLPVGLGVTAYGAVYFFFHDGLVHGRFPVPVDGRKGFWLPRLQAHRIHHAVSAKSGCVSYGFLWVRPARELKAKLRTMKA